MVVAYTTFMPPFPCQQVAYGHAWIYAIEEWNDCVAHSPKISESVWLVPGTFDHIED